MVVDPAGVTYVTGTADSPTTVDVITAAFGPDGALRWSRTYNGPGNWADQGRAVALGPGGVLYVAGNTPDPQSYANVLLLKYDTVSGNLLNAIQYSSGPGLSEYGGSVATDAQGNVYVGGGTVGDGEDAMVLKFNAAGQFQWKRIWDGPAFAPYSQDTVLEIVMDPSDVPVVLIHGVMGSNHPDYVVVKYDPSNGSTIWEANWGSNGEDSPRDMAIDGSGEVYVTGTTLSVFSTIKLRGSDGQLLWQAYDSAGARDSATALALDGQGGVYITGRIDPDGDVSNLNDNIYTVKRDAGSGALQWSHLYGANCLYCYDVPADVIVDPAGNVFVAGSTTSPPYNNDVITLVLDANTGAETVRGIISGGTTQTATPSFLGFDGAYNLLDGGETYDFNTGAVRMSVFKYDSLFDASVPFCGPGSAGVIACPCSNPPAGPARGCDNSSATGGASIHSSGVASLGADTLMFTTAGEKPTATSIVLQGTAMNPSGMIFGQGVRCVSGSLKRLYVRSASGGSISAPAGTDPSVSARSSTLGDTISAGSHRYYMVYYRDPIVLGGCSALSTYNATNARDVTWMP
ncbi:MAG TPA: SBBP repeat-containing protein [Planctomycetota bacterium]|nr:SBBP repeat-containing protein [Planctomycetota bacterium]